MCVCCVCCVCVCVSLHVSMLHLSPDDDGRPRFLNRDLQQTVSLTERDHIHQLPGRQVALEEMALREKRVIDTHSIHHDAVTFDPHHVQLPEHSRTF